MADAYKLHLRGELLSFHEVRQGAVPAKRSVSARGETPYT